MNPQLLIVMKLLKMSRKRIISWTPLRAGQVCSRHIHVWTRSESEIDIWSKLAWQYADEYRIFSRSLGRFSTWPFVFRQTGEVAACPRMTWESAAVEILIALHCLGKWERQNQKYIFAFSGICFWNAVSDGTRAHKVVIMNYSDQWVLVIHESKWNQNKL